MLTPKRLIEGAQLTVAAAVYYTAPANGKALLKKLTLTNTSAAAVTVTLYLVVAAGAAAAGNMLVQARSIAAGATYDCTEVVNHILEAGGTIQALASAATAVTIMASGAEIK
jgi:hypothetical protein